MQNFALLMPKLAATQWLMHTFVQGEAYRLGPWLG